MLVYTAKLKTLFLKKHNFLLFVAILVKFFAVLFGLLTSRWTNNYLDVNSLKEYNLIIGYTPIILGFITFGIPTLIQKNYTNVSDSEKLKDIWATFFYLRWLSYFFGLLIILITFRLSGSSNIFYILGIYSAQFVLVADLSYRSVCDATNQTWKFSATDVLGKLVLLVLLYLGSYLKLTNEYLIIFIFGSVFAYLISYLVDFFWNLEHTKMGKFSILVLKENLKPMLYLSFTSLFFFGAVDRQLLDYYGVKAAAINGYSNAFKIFDIAFIIPSMIAPVFASRAKKHLDSTADKSDKAKILKRWLVVSAIAGLATSFSLFIGSRIIFWIIDPKNLYTEYSLQVIPFYCISLFCYFSTFFHYNMNIFYHREKNETFFQILNSLGFLLLYVILIPILGIVGAAVSHASIYMIDFLRRTIFFLYQTKKD